jgi:hypothetical protein
MVAASLVVGLAPVTSAASGPIGFWRLNGNLKNAKATGVNLRTLGHTTFDKAKVNGNKRTVLEFDGGEGLKIIRIPKSGRRSFTLDMWFEFDDVSEFRRVAIFGPHDTDWGLYIENGTLNLYKKKFEPLKVLLEDQWIRLRITRQKSTRQMRIYVDGILRLSYIDTENDFTLRKGRMTLFRDNPGNTDEESAGSVSKIKLWKRVVKP